jgi:hypothetical protein
VVTECHDQEKRRRADEADVGTWLVLGEHLDRAQSYLIAPGRCQRLVLAQGLGDENPQASRHKAVVALARRLAVIMHRIWVDGTEFRWTKEAVTT